MNMELEKSDQAIALFRNILNLLSASSEEYFFLWDVASKRVYFSENVRSKYALLEKGSFCSFAEWSSLVYPRDLSALLKDLKEIREGKKDTHEMDYRVSTRSGETVWIHCRGCCYRDESGVPLWMVGRISDAVPAQLTDLLTGAFNLDMLRKDLDSLLSDGADGYLLLTGVDGLKSINLKNGRSSGDRLLKQVVQSMEEATDGERRIYRTNGDCFAVLFPGGEQADVEGAFDQIRRRLSGRCTLSGGAVPFRTYLVPDAGTLYQYAENALDRAKAQGKNTLWFFSAEDYEKDLAALELREELEDAIEQDFAGFSLFYQPQVASGTYQLCGAEALLRFRSPRRGDVSPVEFIPILEDSRLICSVGLWVLRSALEQCRQWRRIVPDFSISVNMSYTQLCEADIADRVLEVLRESGLPGSALIVEVTEDKQLLDYPALNEIFRLWKLSGIQISVDDFGTGYSSLGRLQAMDVDEVKIDRSFVSGIQRSVYNYRLLGNMIELADASSIRVCCEGVETPEELAALEELHPRLLQGFLFSRPLPPEQFEELYFRPDSDACRQRQIREQSLRQPLAVAETCADEFQEDELVKSILAAENDIFYISDLETWELYYLNPAGQKLFGTRDYRGKKCYKVLHGRDEPCPFCTNKVLKPDDFFIWEQENEYCGRRFILKDKILTFRGKQMRLEVMLDVTKHEIISENLRQRLRFAEKVVDYTAILSRYPDYSQAVNHVLASVGEFYQADRAYLFEPDKQNEGYWNNTFEWCREGVEPQAQNLQMVPPTSLARWMDHFRVNRSVRIYNLDTLRETNRQEWSDLSQQDITRLIAVPLRMDDRIIGFLGVDNPRYSIHDDSQIRVLSYFLVNRIRQDWNETRLRMLLRSDYRNILGNVGVGLWIILLDKDPGAGQMLVDDTMRQVLGQTEPLSPEECYQFWYSRINDGYYHYVNQSLDSMIKSHRVVQLEYTWNHPQLGEVVVRCTGVRTADRNGKICLEGYHRILSGIQQTQFLPDVHNREIFEYNDLNRTIFFHTDRSLLYGENIHESGFPQCWLDQELVHPHFVETFRNTFSRVRLKADSELPEVLLKSKSGTYEWFRLTLRHLGQDQQDRDTVVAVVEPTGMERVRELENMRIRRFYQVLLSEAIAYAEVDLESGQLKSIGGLWSGYEQDYRRNTRHFFSVLEQRLAHYLTEKDMEEFRLYRNKRYCEELFEKQVSSRAFSYRRPVGQQMRWVELVIHIFREDVTQNVYALIYLRDINSEKEKEVSQEMAASRDPLTGLYNRAAFERELCQYVQSADTSPCGTLLMLDIDNFKQTNDQLGHLEGDKALQRMAGILTATFRHEDIIGRLGGDEFLVFAKGLCDYDSISRRVELLLRTLRSDKELPLYSSVGITLVRSENFRYTRCIKEADIALYRSKNAGKDGFSFYEPLE